MVMNWIHSLSKTYLTEILNIKPPKVLFIGKTSMINDVWKIKPSDLTQLKQFANIDFVTVDSMTEEKLAEKCEGYDYLMLNMDFLPFPDPNKMDKLTEKFYNHPGIRTLKGINVDMTDADFFSPLLAKQKGIPIQTSPNAVTRSVAESALCEIMLHAKQRHNSYANDENCNKTLDLYGKTAGIIGHGNIGKALGKMLTGIGMNVLFNDIKLSKAENTPIEKIFREADVISIHIPAHMPNTNKSNIGFIDSKLLNLCKGTILINVATDIIVDSDSLISALNAGKIVAYSVEPGRKVTEKLKKYKQVHISPCSFDSDETRANVKRIWIDNMLSMLRGTPQNIWN
jgi:phosphoglycerate dehydrogenase-like enzyme